MLKILNKVLLILGLLSLSACSDNRSNKKQENEVISKINTDNSNDKYSKPSYDYRLDNYEYGKVWYDTSDIDSESSYNIGLLYQKYIKDYKVAEFWYKKSNSISLNKDAILNLAILYEDLKEYQKSIYWYKESIALEDKDGAFNLGLLYDKILNDNKEAILFYAKAYNLGSSNGALNLGAIYHKEIKDYEKALFWYKKAIEAKNQNALKNIASLYYEKNHKEQAVAYLISIVALNPKYTKDKVIKYMKTKWKVDDATIKKGYELQLTMDGLSKRYTGGL